MKKILGLAVVLMGLCFMTGSVSAQNAPLPQPGQPGMPPMGMPQPFLPAGGPNMGIKIAVVDLQKVFNDYNSTKDSQKKLEKEIDDKKKEASVKEQELKNNLDDYQKQKALMSPDKQKEKEDQLKAKYDEYQKYYKATLDELQKKERTFTEDLLGKILLVVKAVSTENGYNYVFDKKSLLVGGEDVTDKVVMRLNERK